MNCRKRAFTALASIVILLAGCQPKPEDIGTWKAENNTGRLIKTLNDERQFMRLEAIEALKELKAENAVDPLGALLRDNDVVVKHSAIEALAAINTPSIEPYMLQAVTFNTEPARLASARALGNLNSAVAVEALIAALDDEYEKVGVEAAVALGKIGDSKALPALGKASEKGSVRYRGACVASIRQIGGPGVTELLFAVLGDQSTKVHNEAVAGLIEQGDDAETGALLLLRSPNDHARQGALTILEKIGKVPAAGKDQVWYCLADLAVGENPEIRRSDALEIAAIEGATEPLLKALAHPNEAIREHAFIAIEAIGEPAAAPALAAAADINPEASEWLVGRSTWAGAPAWQLDLWGAATALNPAFLLDARQVMLLNNDGNPTMDLLRSEEFRPQREIVPLLIRQMAATRSESPAEIKSARERRKLAFRKLRVYKNTAKLPLMAALNDSDLQLAAHAAEILVTVEDDPRAPAAVIESFSTRIENGENLHNSPFYDALLELNRPDVEKLIQQVRPNPAGALRVFRAAYPDVQVSNMSLPPGKKHPTAEPFRLKYLKNGKAKEMKLIFRLNEDGNWLPDPPLPDTLP